MTAVQVSNGQTPLPGLLPTFPELHVVRAADHQVAAVQGKLGVRHVREPGQESWSILNIDVHWCKNWRALLIAAVGCLVLACLGRRSRVDTLSSPGTTPSLSSHTRRTLDNIVFHGME